jgi:hypothetical protein
MPNTPIDELADQWEYFSNLKFPAKYRSIFENKSIPNSYKLTLATMLVSPDQISFNTDTRLIAFTLTLLALKNGDTIWASRIFFIDNESFKGFQIGDPDNGDIQTRVILVQNDGKRHELIFDKYNQDEISNILSFARFKAQLH